MSRIRANTITNAAGTGAPTFPNGVSVVGVLTATTFDGSISSLSTNATGTNLTLSGNLTVNGTQTVINTTSLEVADKTIGIGSTSTPSDALADGAGIVIYGTTNKTLTWQDNSDAFTFSETIDIKGAVETVSTGSTYDLGGGRVILECDAKNGTVFTHNLANGTVGIVSLRNFPATKNSLTTYTIIFTQNATGTGNTTGSTGIGTNIFLKPNNVTGFSTSARVSLGSTVTLPAVANDIDIVSFAVHYNGSGTGSVGNYNVYATDNGNFRYGGIRP